MIVNKERKIMQFIVKKYVTKCKQRIISFIFFQGICNIIELIVPILYGMIIDECINNKLNSIVILALTTILLLVFLTTCNKIKSRIDIDINIALAREIKEDIINNILESDVSIVSSLQSGEIFSWIEDSERVISYILNFYNNIFNQIIIFIAVLIVMCNISLPLAFMQLIIIPLTIIYTNKYGHVMQKYEKLLILEKEKYYNNLLEILRGIKEIKGLQKTSNIVDLLKGNTKKFAEQEKKRSLVSMNLQLLYSFFTSFFQTVFLVLSCVLIIEGYITIGMYYSFNTYAYKLTVLLNTFMDIKVEYKSIILSAIRIYPYLVNNNSKNGYMKLTETIEKITLKDIYFKYDEKDNMIIKNLNANFTKEHLNVIVGPNGSGKSTILNILVDYYRKEKGYKYINDIDVDKEKVSYINQVVYVRQDMFFLNFSILDNLRLFDTSISESEIIKVCKKLDMHNYIMTLPEQYNTLMGEGGEDFSGGQLELLSIARSILQVFSVYLFDEITSNLDFYHQKLVWHILNELVESGKLVVVVCHDVMNIPEDAYVFFMKDGCVVSQGINKSLVGTSKMYQDFIGGI